MRLSQYHPDEFGKVAVLMGGQSAERDISMASGNAVYEALISVGVDAYAIDFNNRSLMNLMNDGFDRAFIALHGRGGEDGSIQGALESIGMPYTGTGILGSALSIDKSLSKVIWRHAGLPTPPAIELYANSDWQGIVSEFGVPLAVKPVREGSSIGVSKIDTACNLSAAWRQAHKYDDRVMAERWITGAEYTVPVLHDQYLPIIKLETKREFYDYQAKYVDDDTSYICPCGLDMGKEKELGELGLQACSVLNVTGWARVDMMLDYSGQAWLIEVNTIPGMTSHSLVPMAAKQSDMTFADLTMQILATSLAGTDSMECVNL